MSDEQNVVPLKRSKISPKKLAESQRRIEIVLASGKRAPAPPTETAIKADICLWLKDQPDLTWVRIENQGRRAGSGGVFAKSTERGWPDLLALCRGVLLAIEVKTPTGVLAPHQEARLREIRRVGGYPLVARSVDDVRQAVARCRTRGGA